MSVMEQERSQQQTRALGDFMRAMENVRVSIIEAAQAYKAAKAVGVDLSSYVTPALSARLEVVARGLLIEKIQAKALLIPPRVLDVLEKLPAERQKELAENGLEVWRDGRGRKLRVEEVTWVEARSAFDLAGGRPRLLTAEEQRQRSEPQKPRQDRIEQLRFTPAEYEELQRAAARDGSSVKTYLKRQLYLTGILPGVAREKQEA